MVRQPERPLSKGEQSRKPGPVLQLGAQKESIDEHRLSELRQSLEINGVGGNRLSRSQLSQQWLNASIVTAWRSGQGGYGQIATAVEICCKEVYLGYEE